VNPVTGSRPGRLMHPARLFTHRFRLSPEKNTGGNKNAGVPLMEIPAAFFYGSRETSEGNTGHGHTDMNN
jgi:hypothetical protein